MRFETRWMRRAVLPVTALALVACDDSDPVQPSALQAPTNLTADFTGSAVEVSWSAVSGAETYRLERDDLSDAAGYVELASSAATKYTDTNIEPGGAYSYRVSAQRGTERGPADAVNIAIPAEPITEFSGTIRPGQTRVLSADTTYIMEGAVVVDSGAVLKIQPGTRILGDVDVRGTALFVRIGGRIEAEGTADAPIVFTSSAPEGQRKRGDWGGVVISGRSICSFGAPCQGEGDSGTYGRNPPVLEDDSGILRYVRIEYAGYEISLDNELNALTLNAVGNGTTIEYVQTHQADDDGIEWFGGSVDLKYAVVTGADDDSFDFSTGWQGRGQFWLVQQDLANGDRGWEVDGNEQDHNATPLTNPEIYNVTIIGKGPQGAAGASPAGIQLRRGTAGTYRNGIVIGFDNGLDIDDSATVAHCTTGELTLSNFIFFQNTNVLDPDADLFEDACVTDSDFRVVDPKLIDPYNQSNPDFRPAADSPALTGAATPPNDGFFTAVDFVGAVAPTGELSTWWQGWTTFERN